MQIENIEQSLQKDIDELRKYFKDEMIGKQSETQINLVDRITYIEKAFDDKLESTHKDFDNTIS